MPWHSFIDEDQEWPVTSHRMMMMGRGMPIAQSRIERMKLSL
jgi:hypothetical protein